MASHNFIGLDEDFPGAAYREEVYELIDPILHYRSQTYAGKVVFITGASRGIGAETALQYACAGASVALASRFSETLEDVKSRINAARSDAVVLTLVADVTQTDQVKEAILETVSHFGSLDIVIANAGKAGAWTRPLLEKDPNEWWSVVEVNIRGVFNTIYFSIPHLLETKGYAIVVSSKAAQVRVPFGSDYAVSKHALGRLTEHIYLEYPDIKIFALHPGSIPTEMGSGTNPPGLPPPTDSVALPAATMLYLTSGRVDWLIGRYVSANWDLGEIEREWKSKIVEKGGLVSKLYIPV
ncbi:NAD-P-binding protein [Roridomyces roridus]|uniref:NAD-P-binding protein n=1 Tax=Roridomyces roridus TaxID=1738132 RepID=A0AAD7FHS8_9AGAR|nr:NAD-P-binding protein [Roridomyces roridus]